MILSVAQKRSPICLDFGSRQIKAVQLAQHSGAWAIAAQSLIRKTPDERAANTVNGRRLRGVLQRQGFTGDRVLVLPPADMLKVSPIELPRNAGAAQRDQVARLEFARENRLDGDGFEMAWWALPEPGRASSVTHAMAVGGESDALAGLVDALADAGLQPVRVGASVNACMDLVARHPEGGKAIDAVVDIGWEQARIGVLVGGKVVYERRVAELGLRQLYELLISRNRYDEALLDCLLDSEQTRSVEVAGSLKRAIDSRLLAVFNRIGDETRLAMDYARHRYPQDELGWAFVLGGGAELPRCLESVRDGAAVRTAVVRPGDLLGADDPGPAAASLSTAALLSEVA